MLQILSRRNQLRRALLDSGVTGAIEAHQAKTNLESLKKLLKGDPYVTFGIAAVHDAIDHDRLNLEQLVGIMAESLGITPERFREPGAGYINPDRTAKRLHVLKEHLDATIASGGSILLATAHPGSLTTHYLSLARYITDQGGRLSRLAEPFKVADYRWLDNIGGVHMLTDEGQLMHTHESGGFYQFITALSERPALVLADHGYAGAAINHGITTVALHDVDDPGIPVAEYVGCDVVAVPMNDNQLNQPTVQVIEAVLAEPAAA